MTRHYSTVSIHAAPTWGLIREDKGVRRREPGAKSIGDINEQAARLSNTARGRRLARISRIAQEYRNNINDRLEIVDWPRRANIKVSYGARIGDKLAPLVSKGNSNS